MAKEGQRRMESQTKKDLICQCNHYESVHYDGDHFTWEGPFKTKNRKYCPCDNFKADNLKYLEWKAKRKGK